MAGWVRGWGLGGTPSGTSPINVSRPIGFLRQFRLQPRANGGGWAAPSTDQRVPLDDQRILLDDRRVPKLAGDLFLPADIKPGERRAGIVLCHGYTGVRSIYLPGNARVLAEAGYLVLTFDYKCWGDSDG